MENSRTLPNFKTNVKLPGLYRQENVRACGSILRAVGIRTHDRHLLGKINDREARRSRGGLPRFRRGDLPRGGLQVSAWVITLFLTDTFRNQPIKYSKLKMHVLEQCLLIFGLKHSFQSIRSTYQLLIVCPEVVFGLKTMPLDLDLSLFILRHCSSCHGILIKTKTAIRRYHW